MLCYSMYTYLNFIKWWHRVRSEGIKETWKRKERKKKGIN